MDIETFNAMSEHDQKMQMARLALAGYFTPHDVECLRSLADSIARAVTANDLLVNLKALDEAPLHSLADRIEALLSP